MKGWRGKMDRKEIGFEARDVPVRSIVLTTNPEDKVAIKDCMRIEQDLNENADTEGLPVAFRRAKLVKAGEDDLLVAKGSIMVEIHYMDNVINYTLLMET